MDLFNTKVNLAFEAFYARDYLMSCQIIQNAYVLLLESNGSIVPSRYYMEKGLTIIEEIIRLPEIEPTDYITSIMVQERANFFKEEDNIFHLWTNVTEQIVALLQDVGNLIQYWDEYLGGMNQSPKPSITVGIDAKGQYSFFENIYAPKSAESLR
ncbi:MAG: hypothetical protein ACI94Y_004374 [Maribacter sp.]|jgi:hypothetical protein